MITLFIFFLHTNLLCLLRTCHVCCRSVYLSGGVTMIPGFVDRLQEELRKLAPPSVIVEVTHKSILNILELISVKMDT